MLTAGGRLLYSGLFTRTGLDFTFFLILCHCFSGLPVQVWRPNDTQPGWSICSSLLQRFQGFSCFCCDGKAALAQPLQFTCLLPHSYEQVLQRAWKDAGFVISFIATCPWFLLAKQQERGSFTVSKQMAPQRSLLPEVFGFFIFLLCLLILSSLQLNNSLLQEK